MHVFIDEIALRSFSLEVHYVSVGKEGYIGVFEMFKSKPKIPLSSLLIFYSIKLERITCLNSVTGLASREIGKLLNRLQDQF